MAADSTPRRSRFGRFVMALVVLYAMALAVVAVMVQALADRWWLATVLLFAPRWPWGVPIPLLALFALRQPGALAVLLLAALVFTFGVMGLSVPAPRLAGTLPRQHVLRLMTCNIGGGAQPTVDAIERWVKEADVDVAVFQECQTRLKPLEQRGWYTHNTYGLCVLSRHPLGDVDVRDPRDMLRKGGAGLMARYAVQAPQGTVHVLNVHLESVRSGLTAVMQRQLEGARAMEKNIAQRGLESGIARAWIDAAPAPRIVAGDFNLPVESAIYREHWGDLTNAFSQRGLGLGSTKSTSWHGVRIDHILLGPELSCVRSWVGRGPGHDHRPMLAELRLVPR